MAEYITQLAGAQWFTCVHLVVPEDHDRGAALRNNVTEATSDEGRFRRVCLRVELESRRIGGTRVGETLLTSNVLRD